MSYSPIRPSPGGSHLPDLTVITPIFDPTPGKEDEITSSRRQGRTMPISAVIVGGSMPATSTVLSEEGAEIISFKLVSQGKMDVKGLYAFW